MISDNEKDLQILFQIYIWAMYLHKILETLNKNF
jgi:hypothetical protein